MAPTMGASSNPEDCKPILVWANPRWLALGLLMYFSAMLFLLDKRLYWTPPVRPASAPFELFSEERALAHVQALAGGLPDRQISMPQLRAAHDYISRQGEELAALAAARGADVQVQVFREHVSGSVAMDFTGIPFTNAYRNLTNVVLTLTPSAAEGRPGLLIAAHHDSAVASPGASDDVSMIAVMLETARVLLSRRTEDLPVVPLVFLFDGAEESICQAGHGFFNSSPHARGLGAFINLEAMGAGGLPVLFQHTGAWTVAAWARGARNARGARVAQDIFDTGLIPGDTDYRMFSARHFGSLPGLDIAFVRDSVAYHTALDNVDRLGKGALQDMGEALLGGLISMAEALAADREGRLQQRQAVQERAVYFDLLGCGMVSYPDSWARLLHTAPLALFLMLPLSAVAGGHTAAGVMKRMTAAARRAAASFAACVLGPAVLGVARVAVTGASMPWYDRGWVASGTFLPLAAAAALAPWLGLQREALRERPGQQGHYVACQVYGIGLVLSALAAGLCLAGLQGFSQILALGGILGYCLGSLLDNGAPTLSPSVAAGVCALSTVPLAAVGAILGTFLDVMRERMALTGHHSVFLADGVIGLLSGAAVLGYSCGSLLPLAGYALGGLLEFDQVYDQSTTPGSGGDKGDGSAGGNHFKLRPASSSGLRGRQGWSLRRPLLVTLVAVSLGMAAWSSYGVVPYTATNPRRITLTHLHETGSWVPEDDSIAEAAAALAADAAATLASQAAAAAAAGGVCTGAAGSEEAALKRRQLAAALTPRPNPLAKWALGITDSNPWRQMFPNATAVVQLPYVRAPQDGSTPLVRYGNDALGHEYASLYPLDQLLGKLVMDAEPCTQPLIVVPPYIRLVREESPTATGSSGSGAVDVSRRGRVLHLQLYSEAHCWGMLNVTTALPLRAWSLPSQPVAARLPTSLSPQSPVDHHQGYYHMVRFSHEADSPFWELWLEVENGGLGKEADPWVIVELSATYLPMTRELQALRQALPEWVAPTWIGTTYHSSYRF